MAEELDAENQRISNFQGLVTLTFTLDCVASYHYVTDRQDRQTDR